MLRTFATPAILLSFLLAPAHAATGAWIEAEGPQAGFGDVLVLGPGARLDLHGDDRARGHEFEPRLDGAPVSLETWSTGWEPGPHQVAGVIRSDDGREAGVPPLDIVFDPSAPAVDREIGGLDLLERYGLDQGVDPKKPRRVDRHRDVAVYWSADGRRWLPLLPPNEEQFDWLVESDEPQVFFYAQRDGALRLDDGTPVRKGQVVRLWARDELSAAAALGMSVTRDRMELVVRDLVGNATRRSWALGR